MVRFKRERGRAGIETCQGGVVSRHGISGILLMSQIVLVILCTATREPFHSSSKHGYIMFYTFLLLVPEWGTTVMTSLFTELRSVSDSFLFFYDR